ncbi:MAG TPA: hypothetical protein VMJ10_08070 [Kofleriaceae bacterium]|nr:hypothetical protein [Kofleriaceae bacterium]
MQPRALAIALVLAAATVARADQPTPPPAAADTVALLPLDADQRTEIYSQPFVTEVAAELRAAGIEVVVVGPKMAVPEKALLVIDGTITAGKGDQVALAVRIRERATGSTLDRVEGGGPLQTIDRVASDVAARVLPTVKAQLAAAHKQRDAPRRSAQPPTAATAAQPKTVAIELPTDPQHVATPLDRGLPAELTAWAEHHHWRAALATGATAATEAHLVVTVLAYDVTPGVVPTARARVHVKIGADFDRVVVTDTVVGDRNIAPEQLAARTARAVLDIVEPHMRHAVASWR